jgi:squalene-hopene/tetraprenyl-beta-curcumene cyclase
MSLSPVRVDRAYKTARDALLAERAAEGHWVGELSTSALSTAVAVSALALVQRKTAALGDFAALVKGGLDWLAAHQNADGGWGDTVKSLSNISTTTLCRAAFHLTGKSADYPEPLAKAEKWFGERGAGTPERLAEAVRARYGKDRTFSVPILMTAALAGQVPWGAVPRLPFELACLPQSWFRWLRMPVVSYALPALIAIGQAVHHHRGTWNPVTLLTRRLARGGSLRVLERIQPSNGGFLEAAPLTGFVTLALASIDRADHPVARKGVDFLVKSVRPDGSWPIDTNLSTWLTTLAVNALAAADDLKALDRVDGLRAWLVRQQYRQRHAYTGAEPGGWAWTPLPGGVPDADDTPGALLTLSLGPLHEDGGLAATAARSLGLDWLLGLQNRDGGMPTFCRGRTGLPFDRSGSDLTAHFLRALVACRDVWDQCKLTRDAIEQARDNAFDYLARAQRADGSWAPLWFGNQHAPDDVNPTYGTSRVLAAYRELDRMNTEEAGKGVAWLVAAQNADGGWGGDKGVASSVEETALAVEALQGTGDEAKPAVRRGLLWLVERVEQGTWREPTPIGFYFAKLWYFERLYPLIFTAAALGRARRGG